MASSVFVWPGQFSASGGTVTFSGPILAPDGTAAAPSYSWSSSPTYGWFKSAGTFVELSIGGTSMFGFDSGGISLPSTANLRWSSAASVESVADVILVRDGAPAILALKNAANAQTFRVYGTTTGTKYTALSHDGTNGVLDTAASAGLLSIAPTNATSVAIGKTTTAPFTVSNPTATGATGGAGAALSTGVPQYVVITGAANSGVDIVTGAGVAGSTYHFFNQVAGTINVYAVGGTINGNSGATGYAITSTGNRYAVATCIAAGTWIIRGNT